MYISRRFLQRKNADILLKLTLNTNQSINLQEKPETYLIILILHVCLLKGINENSIKYLIKYCCTSLFSIRHYDFSKIKSIYRYMSITIKDPLWP